MITLAGQTKASHQVVRSFEDIQALMMVLGLRHANFLPTPLKIEMTVSLPPGVLSTELVFYFFMMVLADEAVASSVELMTFLGVGQYPLWVQSYPSWTEDSQYSKQDLLRISNQGEPNSHAEAEMKKCSPPKRFFSLYKLDEKIVSEHYRNIQKILDAINLHRETSMNFVKNSSLFDLEIPWEPAYRSATELYWQDEVLLRVIKQVTVDIRARLIGHPACDTKETAKLGSFIHLSRRSLTDVTNNVKKQVYLGLGLPQHKKA